MGAELESRVCPICGEPLGEKMQGKCSRCGSHIIVNKVTGLPVHVPQAPQRSLVWEILGTLLLSFIVIQLIFAVLTFGAFSGSGLGMIVLLIAALIGFCIFAFVRDRRR